MVLKCLFMSIKESHDNDCKLVFVARDWVRDPDDTSDTIYVPPADWITNQGGIQMYIPPAGWVPDHIDSDEDPFDDALEEDPFDDALSEDDLPDVHDLSATTSADDAAFGDSGASTHSPSPTPQVELDVDLRPENHRNYIYDQGKYASCVANAISSAFVFALNKSIAHKKAIEDKRKKKIPSYIPLPDPETNAFDPSRLFIWYHAREKFVPRVRFNEGCRLRDAIRSVFAVGVSSEGDWPYQPGDFDEETREFVVGAQGRTKPSNEAYTTANKHQIVVQRQIKLQRRPRSGMTDAEKKAEDTANLNRLRRCLDEGYPFAFGFRLFEKNRVTFSTNKVLEMPEDAEEDIGGHAVLAMGYSDAKERFLIQNSWGPNWHEDGCSDGCFFIPYRYILKHTSATNFWTIRKVNNYKRK